MENKTIDELFADLTKAENRYREMFGQIPPITKREKKWCYECERDLDISHFHESGMCNNCAWLEVK